MHPCRTHRNVNTYSRKKKTKKKNKRKNNLLVVTLQKRKHWDETWWKRFTFLWLATGRTKLQFLSVRAVDQLTHTFALSPHFPGQFLFPRMQSIWFHSNKFQTSSYQATELTNSGQFYFGTKCTCPDASMALLIALFIRISMNRKP